MLSMKFNIFQNKKAKMIKEPFFSIITIVKDSEKDILKTLKSVKNQTAKIMNT